jgi:hypothetical protein
MVKQRSATFGDVSVRLVEQRAGRREAVLVEDATDLLSDQSVAVRVRRPAGEPGLFHDGVNLVPERSRLARIEVIDMRDGRPADLQALAQTLD